jgi:hypothetical protein
LGVAGIVLVVDAETAPGWAVGVVLAGFGQFTVAVSRGRRG